MDRSIFGMLGALALFFVAFVAVQLAVATDLTSEVAAAWAQCAAALIGIVAAWLFGRSEMQAQYQAAEEAQAQFDALVLGAAEATVAVIRDVADFLLDEVNVRHQTPPSTVASINFLKALDYNRMSDAEMGVAVLELRRLAGWSKGHHTNARYWLTQYDTLDPMEDVLAEWVGEAEEQLTIIRDAVTG